MTSTPLRNVTPWTALGNGSLPFNRCRVSAAVITKLNSSSRAVSYNSVPLARVVQCPTMANMLAIGLDMRKWSRCPAGKSQKASGASWSSVT